MQITHDFTSFQIRGSESGALL